jgi:hypothetical protein
MLIEMQKTSILENEIDCCQTAGNRLIISEAHVKSDGSKI